MNTTDTMNKDKYKKPKPNSATTHRGISKSEKFNIFGGVGEKGPQCSLLAKDSEWVDILQTESDNVTPKSNATGEEVYEGGPEMKPLALMFPSLLEEEPGTLEGMLNKVMSTTEVTKHLVGQKANFSFMKKVNRLIPVEKVWLESLTEMNNSSSSILSIPQKDSNIPGISNIHQGFGCEAPQIQSNSQITQKTSVTSNHHHVQPTNEN